MTSQMENADFAGRVAIVTGAWRGLGRASAARLHERGALVAVNVRDRQRAEALAKDIGERAFAVPGDVAADGVPEGAWSIAQRSGTTIREQQDPIDKRMRGGDQAAAAKTAMAEANVGN